VVSERAIRHDSEHFLYAGVDCVGARLNRCNLLLLVDQPDKRENVGQYPDEILDSFEDLKGQNQPPKALIATSLAAPGRASSVHVSHHDAGSSAPFQVVGIVARRSTGGTPPTPAPAGTDWEYISE
jgi:hypothetical protein